MVDDLGGVETLTAGQQQLIKRCAMISVACELMEKEAMIRAASQRDRLWHIDGPSDSDAERARPQTRADRRDAGPAPVSRHAAGRDSGCHCSRERGRGRKLTRAGDLAGSRKRVDPPLDPGFPRSDQGELRLGAAFRRSDLPDGILTPQIGSGTAFRSPDASSAASMPPPGRISASQQIAPCRLM